ncbi:MAG: hypothetical protein RLZZ342_286 [Candidatus Parcubacteria bacterium]|jgi:hypothetical protein
MIPPQFAYTGADATLEILIMLAGAALLGYLLRVLMESHCAPAVKTPAATAPIVLPQSMRPDDLKLIEGIGPKIEKVLQEAEIKTFAQLASKTAQELRAVLDVYGDRFGFAATETWPKQAALARDGKFPELEEYKKRLYGGMEPRA